MTHFQQIIPADDWFYVTSKDNITTALRVVCWALTLDGNVIGLGCEAAAGQPHDNQAVASLTPIPASEFGAYKHKEELTPTELMASTKDNVPTNLEN